MEDISIIRSKLSTHHLPTRSLQSTLWEYAPSRQIIKRQNRVNSEIIKRHEIGNGVNSECSVQINEQTYCLLSHVHDATWWFIKLKVIFVYFFTISFIFSKFHYVEIISSKKMNKNTLVVSQFSNSQYVSRRLFTLLSPTISIARTAFSGSFHADFP